MERIMKAQAYKSQSDTSNKLVNNYFLLGLEILNVCNPLRGTKTKKIRE